MIQDDNRLIIILGMAHSGTTILTYILQQHPDISCYVNGEQSHLLENSWLLHRQVAPIQHLLNQSPGKRILLKRPWMEVNHGDWLMSEMPNARFIYCYRDFTDIAVSWSKSTSNAGDGLRRGSRDHQKKEYDINFKQAMDFRSKVPFFNQHYHPDFVEHPKKIINKLTEWLGLRPFSYDVSQVSSSLDIKKIISVVPRQGTTNIPNLKFNVRKK